MILVLGGREEGVAAGEGSPTVGVGGGSDVCTMMLHHHIRLLLYDGPYPSLQEPFCPSLRYPRHRLQQLQLLPRQTESSEVTR